MFFLNCCRSRQILSYTHQTLIAFFCTWKKTEEFFCASMKRQLAQTGFEFQEYWSSAEETCWAKHNKIWTSFNGRRYWHKQRKYTFYMENDFLSDAVKPVLNYKSTYWSIRKETHWAKHNKTWTSFPAIMGTIRYR
jgi:hypothetical protein